MDEVFAETSVFINEDEKIIVREPEFLDGLLPILLVFWFLTEEIQYHDGLRSRELGQDPILLCAPNS